MTAPHAQTHQAIATALRTTQLRSQAQNSLIVCQLEMQKATPDLDKAYDFAARALRAIGTLNAMTLEATK